MDSILRVQTPGPKASGGGPSSIVTRSMAKSLGLRPEAAAAGAGAENTTPVSSLPAAKSEKRKRMSMIKREPDELKPPVKKSCQFCEEEPVSVTFYPCLHQTCCLDCSLRLKKCPRCKRPIGKKVGEDGQAIELEKPISYTELLSKVRELEENQLCSICMAHKKAIVFNCGHMACQSCTNSLSICHYCRADIRTRTRIFEV